MVFMSKRMIACDEAGFLISKERDDKLSFREKISLRIHLMTCHFCRKYEKQIKQLHNLLGIYREEHTHEEALYTMSAKRKDVILHTLEQELDPGK